MGQAMQTKLRALLVGAVGSRCEALVISESESRSETMGDALGTLLRTEFWGHFKEVALVGGKDFLDSVENAIGRTWCSVVQRADNHHGACSAAFSITPCSNFRAACD